MLHLCPRLRSILFWTALLLVFSSKDSFGQPLETLNASYASVTGSRIPLWIAKDAGLFEKYGLQCQFGRDRCRQCGHRRAGGWRCRDSRCAGNNDNSFCGKRAFGRDHRDVWSGSWKLAAHPSITSVQELRGKTVGISRPGTTIEFATRRALLKLGFRPGQGCQHSSHGLSRVEQADHGHASRERSMRPCESRTTCSKRRQRAGSSRCWRI